MTNPIYTPPPAASPITTDNGPTGPSFTQFVAALVVAVVVTVLAVFLIVAVEKPAPTVIPPTPKPPVTRNIAQEWTACMFNRNTTTADCNKIVQQGTPADTYIAFSQCTTQASAAADYLLCIAILPTAVTS